MEAFAGEHILPVYKRLNLFWFSRYGPVGNRQIKFRFSTAKFDQLEVYFNNLRTRFVVAAYGDYDYVGDLGSDRFLAGDARCQDRTKRANLVYSYLTAGAKLLLASIVREPDGHWHHEIETRSHLNRHTSLESVHHLFCNMTWVPTYVELLSPPGRPQDVISDVYARNIIRDNPELPHRPFKIVF